MLFHIKILYYDNISLKCCAFCNQLEQVEDVILIDG